MKGAGYIVGAAVATVLVTSLYGCASPADAKDDRLMVDEWRHDVRTLNDGRKIDCLVLSTGYGNSISCDWERAGAKP